MALRETSETRPDRGKLLLSFKQIRAAPIVFHSTWSFPDDSIEMGPFSPSSDFLRSLDILLGDSMGGGSGGKDGGMSMCNGVGVGAGDGGSGDHAALLDGIVAALEVGLGRGRASISLGLLLRWLKRLASLPARLVLDDR